MRVTSQAATALPGMVATPMTTPVKKACAVEQVEALEQRRLAEVERDRDERIGREHRGTGEAGAEQQRDQDHAGAGGDAGREAEDARADGEPGACRSRPFALAACCGAAPKR